MLRRLYKIFRDASADTLYHSVNSAAMVAQTRERTEPHEKMATRLPDLDRAKGITIILVVIGHVVSAHNPASDAQWYYTIREVIYLFHMPFFVYISGYIYFMTTRIHTQCDYFSYVKNRADRLMLPFVLFSLFILCGKLIVSTIIYVDNVPNSFSEGLVAVYWDTSASPAPYLWYIVAIFIYCCITPVILNIMKLPLAWLFAISFFLHYISAPEYIYMNHVFKFYVFFVIGVILSKSRHISAPLIDKTLLISTPLFMASIYLCLSNEIPWTNQKLIVGILCIPVIHGISRAEFWKDRKWIEFVGNSSFSIYLFNSIGIGFTKAICLMFAPWDGAHLIWMFVPLTAGGLFIPIILKRHVFSHVAILAKMTR